MQDEARQGHRPRVIGGSYADLLPSARCPNSPSARRRKPETVARPTRRQLTATGSRGDDGGIRDRGRRCVVTGIRPSRRRHQGYGMEEGNPSPKGRHAGPQSRHAHRRGLAPACPVPSEARSSATPRSLQTSRSSAISMGMPVCSPAIPSLVTPEVRAGAHLLPWVRRQSLGNSSRVKLDQCR